ncbi:phosphonopyruvate decarboxylase [Nanoarchaeota archaeon]
MDFTSLSEIFKKHEISFFSGVPDSTFKGWMSYLAEAKDLTNIVAVNECEATAICAGYNLSTGKLGVVYMQNSGLGKCVNPLTSLCDKEVYSIPMLLMIGLRGEPGKKDEPQHKKMGRITFNLLDCLEVPYEILPDNPKEAEKVIAKMKEEAFKKQAPVALIIKKGVIDDYPTKTKKIRSFEMSREEAIKTIIDFSSGSEAIISTTGKTSRELFEYRISKNQDPKDFYMVGSMGCVASLANSVALQKPQKKIFAFDGDGAILMQLGSMATIGYQKPNNLYHFIFDNGAHGSTGGQPTISDNVDFKSIALASGYAFALQIETKKELEESMKKINDLKGPVLLIIKVNSESRKDLGRPTKTPLENKESFLGSLRD